MSKTKDTVNGYYIRHDPLEPGSWHVIEDPTEEDLNDEFVEFIEEDESEEEIMNEQFEEFKKKFEQYWYQVAPYSTVEITEQQNNTMPIRICVKWYIYGKEFHSEGMVHYGEFEMIRGIDGVVEHFIMRMYREYTMTLLGKVGNYDNNN